MLLKYTRPRLLAIWKTLIQSARLSWKYYEAVVHHTVALKISTNFDAGLLQWFRIRSS